MTLHCTLVRGPCSASPRPPLELTIDAPAGTSGALLHARLVHEFGAGRVTVGGEDLHGLTLGSPPLVNGAVLVDGAGLLPSRPSRRRTQAGPDMPLALAVHSGAGAGTVVPLQRGSYTLGRSNTRIVIPDPAMSREHARLVVTESAIMIVDLDSANGTHVDGARVRCASISTASSIRCGSSTMSLVLMDASTKDLADAGSSTSEPIIVPGRPDSASRIVLVLTAGIPLAIGVALAVLTGMWIFLAFASVSAVSVLVPFLTGRRRRRAFACIIKAAVSADHERRKRAGPSLAMLVLAADAGPVPDPGPGEDHDGAVWLRIGQADQPANVRVGPADRTEILPSAGVAPVLLDPGQAMTTLHGPGTLADALLRSCVMQLAGYPRGRGTRVLIYAAPERLPLAARYLPTASLTASRHACLEALDDGFGPGRLHGVLLFVVSPGQAEDGICDAALQSGWQVLRFLPPGEAGHPADVELSDRASLLRRPDGDVSFVPDLAREHIFSGFCRQLAAEAPAPQEHGRQVPSACGLQDILPLSRDAVAARWTSCTEHAGLAVPLGISAGGIRTLDLQSDGPHLLVAGTTGSGKSELLRTLTVALALCYSPERVNFLFFDFKGGSGLGPLTGLVHCVGLVTDLDSHELDRTLVSLRAEVKLREQALAAALVPDLAAYRSSSAAQSSALPHLIVIIDEFRMLVDDAPEVLRELMRIAAIGRSLGIHLVMATQRPQGAVTADIRANITSSIALRVQSDTESTDVINSKAAAEISVDLPGRAYLARGTEPPQLFHAASIWSPAARNEPKTVIVRTAVDRLTGSRPAAAASPVRASPTPAEAAAPIVAMVREIWTARGGAAPRSPVAPALPRKLPLPHPGRAGMAAGADNTWSVELGLIDLPMQQKVRTLSWRPSRDSHLAFVGGPVSGAPEALRLAADLLLGHPTESHSYILDADGSLTHLAHQPRTGAHAGLHELRRSVRILERLTRELGRRLGQHAGTDVPLMVIIGGWGSWVSAFRAGPLAWAEDLVQDLIRDGGKAGITVMVSGDRELVTARFYGALPNRLYFPAGSNEDSRAAWPRLPVVPSVKGRAVAFGPVAGIHPAVCQLYGIDDDGGGWSGEGPPRDTTPGVAGAAARRPFRVEPLPAVITDAEVGCALTRSIRDHSSPAKPVERPGEGTSAIAGTGPFEVVIGITGDELEPAHFRLPAGGVFTILGAPGTGKTNALRAMRALNPGHRAWLQAESGTNPGVFWKSTLARAVAGELSRDVVLLADDADLLAVGSIRDLAELHDLGHAVVLTANYSPLLLQRVPLVMESRAAGSGLLLAPRSASDGDLFAVRFEVEPSPPPGRGVLISTAASRPVQVAWACSSMP